MKKIIIDTTRLSLLLEKNKRCIGSYAKWTTPLSIFISLLLTRITCDFKDCFALKANEWKFIVNSTLIISLVCSIYLIIKQCQRRKLTSEKLCQEICELDETINEHRALLICSDISDHKNEILVYYDLLWECFLLPHYPIDNNIHISEIKTFIADDFHINNKDILIEKVATQESRKQSKRTNLDKNYIFEYFLMRLDNIPENYKQKQFDIAGRRYCWMSLSELQGEKNTMYYNGDVINYLERNLRKILIKDVSK